MKRRGSALKRRFLTSSVLVKLWSKFSAKSEIVQNDEKMTVFEGFKP